MAYKRGVLGIVGATFRTVVDNDADGYLAVQGSAYLPHKCNEWVIGGPEEAQALIDDLQAYIANRKASEGVKA